MYLNIQQHKQRSTAVIDDTGVVLTYGDICFFSTDFGKKVRKRSLILILCVNSAESLLGYIASISNKVVPILIGADVEISVVNNYIKTYQPDYIWLPKDKASNWSYHAILEGENFVLMRTEFITEGIYDELSLLLPTSGSTGSPKLVRHSYNNLNSSARNVAQLFNIQKEDRALVFLPMYYTMGLSVITSHLYNGATVLLTRKNITDKSFWSFLKDNKTTIITGVPFSYEIMNKLRFFKMDLPDLKVISQGGGKLRRTLFSKIASYCESTNRKFIATYGQTEGTARMAYLPPEYTVNKVCSIGKAIPNGKLYIVDDNLNIIQKVEATGQLVYEGDNVTLGYATCKSDFAQGDMNNKTLYTGDIAFRDKDGFYYIVGRMKRFLKLYGLRISLDQVEYLVKTKFNIDCVCSGDDKSLDIFITKENLSQSVKEYVVQKTNLFHKSVNVNFVKTIKRNEIGKVIF